MTRFTAGRVRCLSNLVAILFLAACAAVPPQEAAPLRVMTYNIHAGKDAEQRHNLERVAEIIGAADADIVLLQEVDRMTRRAEGEDHLAEVARLTGLHSAFAKSLDFQGGEYGIAVLSRHPLDSVRVVPLPVRPPQERSGGVYEPRVGLHVIVRAPGGPLHVMNTHLDPGGEPVYRHQEVMGLLAHIARHVPAGAPLVFGGDLNARPDTPEITALSLLLTDAWRACGGAGDGHSFPAHQPDRRIDYIMLRNATCSAARVIDTQASDHRPVSAVILVP
jgi:endonuclease/exonuclease/phosphatase family metal-dependent hydrolase